MAASRLRILFVLTPALHPNEGGVQMSTCKLGRHFLSIGHDVSVFSFASIGHSRSEPMQLFHAYYPGGPLVSANLRQLAHTVERVKPDVIINQMPYEHKIGQVLTGKRRYLLLGCLRNTLYSVKGDMEGFINRVLPKPVRPFFHNPVGRKALLHRHRRSHGADLRRILETYDYFVMFGSPNLEELDYFVPGYDRKKVRLIPNSIPAVADMPPPKEKRILWLGRLSLAQKKVDLIPKVWRWVCERLPDWQLDVVGDGPDRAEIERQIGVADLPRVNFHGRQIPDYYYRRAAIFFMTSAFEGFPNTLVEAQSFGAIPVVFDSYPIASWIVENGKSGYLVEPFDVDVMAQRIIELANDPKRAKFAEHALESARRFHIDRVGQKWQELFEAEVPKHTQLAVPKTGA